MGKLDRRYRWLSLAASATLLAATATAYADGLIVVDPVKTGGPGPYVLEVKYHQVEVDINGRIASTRVDQVFHNPTGTRLEGTYLFPMPRGARMDKFSMFIDGKEVEAELLDAAKAKGIYEDIVRKMKDPALLEYSGTGVFKVRIFPIEPQADKRVKISYTEALAAEDGILEYTYPLNTEKFSAKPLQQVSLKVDIRSEGKIKTVYCPTHDVEIKHHDERHVVVGYEAKSVKPDTDFTVYYSTDQAEVGISVLTHHPAGKDGYFLLTVSPGATTDGREVARKDITFVLDTSGSMAGAKLEQAKRALVFCINNLNEGDRFEVIRFSTEADAGVFAKLTEATEANRKKALDYVKDMKPIGGTNIQEALTRALSTEPAPGRPHMVVFLTDGRPTIGETDEEALVASVAKANTSGTRVFTFGIGDDINTHLLDKITEATRAYRTYVRAEEDIEVKVSSFYTKVQSPVLVDLKLDFGGNVRVEQLYPREMPDLFSGSQLPVFGRYLGSGDASVTLKGTVNGKERVFSGTANFTERKEENDFVARLWATRRVGYLLDQMRLHGESKEVKDEIVELARNHGIVTPYTSYLIVEDERGRVARREMPADRGTLSGSVAPSPELGERVRRNTEGLHAKGGAVSVGGSTEVQELNSAYTASQVTQGRSRLDYTDAFGNKQNLAQQFRNIQGRAVYQAGRNWTDSRVQTLKNPQLRRVQFASDEYFTILREKPDAAQFMALGRNVQFAMDNTIYDIYE